MSDSIPPSPPDADPARSPNLPAPRGSGDESRQPPEAPVEQISLEEMMERLQRSGESRSGESRSGRRRRSSSGSSRSTGSSRSSETIPPPAAPLSPPKRAVLPPPRVPDRALLPAPDRARRQMTPRRRRWWIIGMGILVFLLGAAWLGFRQLSRWRIEGEGFRVNAARRVSELVDRRVSFSRFRHTGTDRLGNAAVTLTPVHQDLLESATFTDLTAQLAPGSWLADEWTIRSLRLRRADLAFLPGKKLDAQTIWQTAPAPVDRGAPDNSGFRIGLTSDPSSVVLETGRFDELNLSWPSADGKPEFLNQLEGNFRVADQTIQLEMTGGLLDTAAWPPLPVQQLNARLKGSTLEIISARLGFAVGHEVRVSGSANLVPAGKLQLQADISPILLKQLLPEAWMHTVMGSFEAPNVQWLSHFQSGPAPSLSGPFRVKGLVLRSLPFVEKIATLLRKPDLALMEFPILSGQFAWTPQGTRLTGLSASTADDLLRLRGDVTIVPGENVTGKLTIDANEAYFAGLLPGTPTLFTPSTEGWRSLTFALSGREDALSDSIGIAPPVIIDRPPSRPAEPIPASPPDAAAVPGVAPPTSPRTVVPVPAVPMPPRKLSDEELERSFNDILGR